MAVELTTREEFAILTLNRPEALNALSFKIIEDIGRAFDEVAKSKARALIITGAGTKAFCAGADIKELRNRDLTAQKRRRRARPGRFLQARHAADRLDRRHQWLRLRRRPRAGAGLHVPAGDANAKVGLPEIKLGLIPGYGGTQRLPRVVGEARALEMIMTGRTVGAEEADRIGLVNRIVDGDPVAAGMAFAREFTGYSLPVLGSCALAP